MARLVELSKDNIETVRKKNADYASVDDPFQNFELCEKIANIPTEVGIFVRLTDKIQRIGNLLGRDPSVKDESIDDALSDLANYALILRVYLEQKRLVAAQPPITVRFPIQSLSGS
jgi:hypothetical protein